MNDRNIVNGLALFGAIIVIVGVMFAASSALAEERPTVVTTAVAIHNAADTSVIKAETATIEATVAASEQIARDIRLDLDIRLVDRTSTAATTLQ